MSKKIISLLLSLMLVVSMVAVAAVSVSAEVDEQGRYTPSEGTDTYRYYFYMPSDWYNEYAETAGIYWWLGTDPADPWPGYIAHPTETEDIYYCDVPTNTTTIIWNNGFDGGNDTTAPEYTKAIQTIDIACQFYSDGDSDVYTTDFYTAMEESYNGDKAALGSYADNFFYDDVYDLGFVFNMNNMIYVINPDMVSENYQGKITSGGEWYFYYGNGEYGTYPTRDAAVANGALYTSDYQPAKDTPATEPATDAPSTDPVETEPVTDAPATEPATSTQSPYLTVNATSNYFPMANAEYNEETNEVTVTYLMKSTKDVLDTQWYLTYDSDVLSYSSKNNLKSISPSIGTSAQINATVPGIIKYNATNLYLFDFTTEETPFVEVIFDVKDLSAVAPVTTTIDLTVDVLRVSAIDPDTFMSKSDEEVILVDFCTVYNNESTATVTVDRNTKLTPSTFVPSTEPTTTVAPTTTVEPTTAEPTTTEEPTTAEPTEKYPNLKVTATSNYFPEATAEYDSTTNEVTVTYYLQTTKDVLDTQWYLKYDSEILTLSDKNTLETICPSIGTAAIMNKNIKNQVKYNATNLSLFDFTSAETPFAQFVFNVNDLAGMDDPVSTTIDLTVDVLRVSEIDAETLRSDEDKELILVDNCIPSEDDAAKEATVSKRTVLTESTVVPPETTEPSTGATTPVNDYTYVVAGSEELCGVAWKGSPSEAPENVMVKDGDYYVKTFEAVSPAESLQLKVVENATDGTQTWIGDATDNNITFNVTQTCDVTVTFDPETREIKVEGDYVQMVTELKIDSMRVVGNGDGTWLNGANWDPAANENLMTEISDKVYQITIKDVEMFEGYQFKFAANGSWADNWGGVFEAFDAETTAVYNSNDNITFDVLCDLADVTITLDLTNFNYSDKTGATFTVSVTEKSVEPETTAPETTEPEVTEPEVTEPTTVVEPTDATVADDTTVAPETDATSATGSSVSSGSTSDTPSSSSNSSAVQTGDASFAVIILSILIAATGVMFVLRKRETF